MTPSFLQYARHFAKIVSILSMMSISALAQPEKVAIDTSKYVTDPDELPEPVGGTRAIMKNVTYPEILKRAGIEGTSIVEAFINERGGVDRATILRGVNPAIDSASVDAILRTAFLPGRRNGIATATRVTIPIRFSRNESDRPLKHTLYPGNYAMSGGGIAVAENARWRAFHAPSDRNTVRLILDESLGGGRGVWSVVSRLTPAEAKTLSKELLEAARRAEAR